MPETIAKCYDTIRYSCAGLTSRIHCTTY